MDVLHSFLPPQNPIKRHWVGGTLTGPHAQERERERERERESESFWLKSTCRRPPREGGTRGRPVGGAESGLCFSGGWTFSRVGGSLSHYVAMFLLASARGPSR